MITFKEGSFFEPLLYISTNIYFLVLASLLCMNGPQQSQFIVSENLTIEMQKLKILTITVLIIICIYNSGTVIYNLIEPKFPIIQVEKKRLNDTEFPLIFHICLNELRTNTRENDISYKSFGYNSSYEWFIGQSMYGNANYGWSGHTKDGSTIGKTKGFHYVTHVKISYLNVFFRISTKLDIEME